MSKATHWYSCIIQRAVQENCQPGDIGEPYFETDLSEEGLFTLTLAYGYINTHLLNATTNVPSCSAILLKMFLTPEKALNPTIAKLEQNIKEDATAASVVGFRLNENAGKVTLQLWGNAPEDFGLSKMPENMLTELLKHQKIADADNVYTPTGGYQKKKKESVKRTSGKVHTGPRGGRYYLLKGRKVYMTLP